MAKMVGYACSLRLPWLNKAVQLLSENLDEKAYKEALNDYLSFEIDGETRLRKSRDILMRVWYKDDSAINSFREEGLRLIQRNDDYAPLVHLCLIYLSYPVVADICRYMGKIFEFEDEITTAMLKQKLYDEWGERGSLESTARRVTLTLKELGLLQAISKTRYVLNRMSVTDEAVINFILAVALKVESKSYSTFPTLTEYPFMFPFDYRVSKEQLMMDDRFVLSTFDATLCVALRNINQK